MDDSSNQRVREVGVIPQLPKGHLVNCEVHLQFQTTNNEAEYEVVLLSLDLAKATGASLVVIHCDSQIVVRHINEDYKAKEERMKEYLSMVIGGVSQRLLAKFVQISREDNEQVDCLAKATSAKHMVITGQVLSFIQYPPSIDKIDIHVIRMRDY